MPLNRGARLGFIGIGLMGAPMVRRLRSMGWAVTAWNREPERFAEIEAQGAVWADSPAALRAASDIVLTCVLDGAAVEACCFGPGGLAQAPGATLLVDTSTIDPQQTVALAGRLATAGMGWVDAPLSGGPDAAAAGALTIMAGGTAAAVARAQPVLNDLAANVTHAGALGAGQAAKILNQAIVGTSYLLVAEVLALAEAAAMDAAALPACLAGGMADSTVLQRIFPADAGARLRPAQGLRAAARQGPRQRRGLHRRARARSAADPARLRPLPRLRRAAADARQRRHHHAVRPAAASPREPIMTITRRHFAAAALAAPALLSRPANAAEFNWKFATNQTVNHPSNIRGQEAIDRIREQSGGRLSITLFPNNQLGGDTDMFSQIRSGAIQLFRSRA